MQLSVKEAARLLRVPEDTIYQWIRQDDFPASRVNEQYRLNRAELLEWATAHGVAVSPEIFSDSERSGTGLPCLTNALEAGGITYGLRGNDKAAVLQSLIHAIRLPEDADRDFLFQVLLARESLGSTGIGDGIAIPHVRNPIVLQIHTPIIALCFLEHPIAFEAIDGQPVNILFALISPTVKSHLHLLSRLSYVLKNPEFRNALKRQASREEVMSLLAKIEAALPPPANPVTGKHP